MLLNFKQNELNDYEIKQYQSFRLSEELRASSDDLTRYCRTYVITNDSKWEKKFWEVLAVRNGEIPRPDGRTISLKDSMIKIGFSNSEIELFNLSESNSNKLVKTELDAFNAIKGLYRDSLGNYTIKKDPNPEWAKKILFDDEYHLNKKSITKPIYQFDRQVDLRTANEINKIKIEVSIFIYILILLIISLIAIFIFFLILIQNKIKEQVKYERRLKEAKLKAEESAEFKSRFLENMSHEIRTPLNAVIGFANQLIHFYPSDRTYQKYINIVKNSGEHLLNLINDILEMSKIEANKLTFNKVPIHVNDMLADIYQLFMGHKDNVGKSKLELKLKKIEDNKLVFLSDETKLRQVLTNLLNNAIKFTEEGSVELGCEFKKDTNQILFYVKDSGVGIPEEQIRTIFKRFLQSDQTVNENKKGTGLGLEISQAIVNALGGQIWVESEINHGSTFFFTLPYIEAKLPENNRQEEIKEKNQKSKKILVAEDSDVNFLLLKLFLKEKNHDIIRVVNGLEAVETMKDNDDIDLILMDVRMPKLNGWDAILEIRKFNKKIPIIVQTANSFDSDFEESMRVGATDFISKPIKKEVLLKKINSY